MSTPRITSVLVIITIFVSLNFQLDLHKAALNDSDGGEMTAAASSLLLPPQTPKVLDSDMNWTRTSNITFDETSVVGSNISTSPNKTTTITSAPLTDDQSRRDAPSQILRVDWTNLTLYSPIAKILHNHYHNCSLPVAAIHRWRTRTCGLGSELHAWGNALYDAWEQKIRFRHMRANMSGTFPEWPWLDQDACHVAVDADANGLTESNLDCYFPSIAQPKCNNDKQQDNNATLFVLDHLLFPGKSKKVPQLERWNNAAWRAATSEFLFSSVSPLVIKEAERQVQQVFNQTTTPPNLIAVHVRWGDKRVESTLKPIEDYVNAAKQIVQEQQIDANSINVLLCSEDPAAIQSFQKTAPSHWNIYIDQMYTELIPYRSSHNNFSHFVDTTRRLRGKPGLWALGSLLVTMEATYYVLGTVSNWSRLINELRKNVIDPRCNKCTSVKDIARARGLI